MDLKSLNTASEDELKKVEGMKSDLIENALPGNQRLLGLHRKRI